jgi:hypothetical protein
MNDTLLLDTVRQALIEVQKDTSTDATIQTVSEDESNDSTSLRGSLKPGNRRAYVLAGNANGKATFTIKNPTTQVRFTYRARPSEDGKIFFVDLLRGADNTNDFSYIGIIDVKGMFKWTAKSKVSRDALSFKAFEFFSRHWEDARLDVWQEGRCGRCGRKLTVPESIDRGLGPDCAGKLF